MKTPATQLGFRAGRITLLPRGSSCVRYILPHYIPDTEPRFYQVTGKADRNARFGYPLIPLIRH